jgi:hypothetical protein
VTDPLTVEPAINTRSPAGTSVAGFAVEENFPAQSVLVNKSPHPVAEHLSSEFEGWAVLAVGVIFFLGILFQISPLNGSLRLVFWARPWRNDIGVLRAGLFLLLPFAAIAQVLRKAESQPNLRISLHLGILALSSFLLQVMGIMADPKGIGLIREIVLSPTTTSYFSDALRINFVAGLLRYFDRLMLGLHSSTHPPGPILFFYVFLKLFGLQAGALVSGLVVGGLGALGVLLAYAFAGLWTDDRHTRMLASALYALLPAMTIFFPELNQVYPIFLMLLIIFWCRALESQRMLPKEAIYLGLALSVALFFSYAHVTIGVFLAYYGLYWLWRKRWTRASFVTLLRNSGIAVGLCVLIYAALHFATGYRPIAAFRSAQSWQVFYQGLLHRTNAPLYALYDPYEFLLGAGMLVLPLVLFQLCRSLRNIDLTRNGLALTLIGLATILTIDLSGLMRGEAARVWLFLQPLIVVPAALELSRFRWRWQLAIFSMQWLIVVALKAKIFFHVP